MTLSKQLMIVLVTLFILIFAGTFAITLTNSKTFFVEQLDSNAQDTATSLGLSLSQPLAQKDTATMLSMVMAIFDRGYFSKVQVVDMKGKVIVERKIKFTAPRVPKWFVELIEFSPKRKSAIIMDGWHQAGRVVVMTNPAYAYQGLWFNTKGIFFWYASLLILLLIGGSAVIKYLFKPLKNVVAQADAICSREFPIEKNIPKTLELKQVTIAMNKMVGKLKDIFAENANQTEELRAQAFQDPLTQMGNRRYFDNQLSHLLKDEEHFTPGVLMMVELDGLNEFNHRNGYQAGDDLILALYQACQDIFKNYRILAEARISGSTLAVLICESDQAEINKILEELIANGQAILSNADKGLVLSIGAVPYHLKMGREELLAACDEAVRTAHEKGQYAYYVMRSEVSSDFKSSTEWRDIIDKAIASDSFVFYQQGAQLNGMLYHNEIFIRLLTEDGQEVMAGKFLPFAEKYDKGFEIDKLVLKHFKGKLANSKTNVALNLSTSTLKDESNRDSYLLALQTVPKDIRNKIHLEFSEANILTHFDEMKRFVHQLHALGFVVGIDKVGANFTPLYYLGELKIDYVKLDGSLSQDLTDNQSKQFFVHNLSGTAKTMDVRVIATNIDSSELWAAYQKLNIKGGQGFYLAGIKRMD
jgi:diguanylate cyclase (GGDEF)-like protein